MFDPRTAELLQSAPGVPGLAADDLPKALTRAYARLVSDRLEGGGGDVDVDDPWSVDRIADTYEIVASLEQDASLRRAAAFVAGTAQQIIARRAPSADRMVPLPVDRDGVDASVAAALLFLAAEQYGDANEAAAAIAIPQRGMRQSRELGRHVRDLARGNLTAILDRIGDEPVPAAPAAGRLERDALRRLLAALARGIEHLAAHLLSPPDAPLDELAAARALFSRVLELCADRRHPDVDWTFDGEEELGAADRCLR